MTEMTEPTPPHDNALRAMTDDGAFRVVTLRTTDTVTRAIAAQEAAGPGASLLAELITSAILVRETMAPTHRVQVLLTSPDRKQRLVADAYPDGGTRGLITRLAGNDRFSIDGWTMEVLRSLHNGDVHRGVVAVPTGGGMSEALMVYLQSSEQVASMLSVACVWSGALVRCSGGYLVQLLPEVGRAPLAIMAERLRDFQKVDALLEQLDAAPGPMVDELLYGMPFTRLEERPLSWKCRCSAVRVMSSLATLPRADVQEIIDAGQPVELTCDFCRQVYTLSPTQLGGLLDQS